MTRILKSVRLPRPERRRQLLDVARRVFAARGYEAASLEEIAEAAGVTRPVVYSHFGDKQSLFEAVVSEEIDRVEAVVSAAIADPGEPRELLERGLRAFFDYVREHPDGHAVLTRDAPVHLSHGGLGTMLDSLATRIAKVIEGANRRFGLDPSHVPAPLFAHALIGIGAHVGRWWREHPEMDLDTVTRHSTTMVWSGFGGLMEEASTRTREARRAR